MNTKALANRVFRATEADFLELAIEVFQFQYSNNVIYRQYVDALHIQPNSINSVEEVPFLPIQFFKSQIIQTLTWDPEMVFTSSGTTGSHTSRHYVKKLDWYQKISILGFEQFYGPIEDYCVLALLPAYLEREGSSLVYMVDQFIRASRWPQSGFYLHNYHQLSQQLIQCQEAQIPTILIGVSFALWELAEQYPMNLSNVTIMETGGMKGRRKEIIRPALHNILKKAFQVSQIHSEYGMTELLSQAYAPQNGIFYPSPTMRVISREVTDPLSIIDNTATGCINIIDLANINSIAFIATDDLGKVYPDGSFEVLGRLDQSDIRGCNLLVA